MADAKLLRELKEDLVGCYKEYVTSIPISPVREDLQVPLVQLYVQPQLKVNNTQIFGQRGRENSNENVSSYKEIFFGKQNSPYKNIYISANAGMGKTSFARKVTLTWCEALKPEKNPDGFFDHDDLKTVKDFDLVFYIELTDTKCCDIAEMISDFIERYLCRGHQYSKSFVERALNTNRSLVILDGLDQWTHPESCQRQGVPHNRHSRNVTVMTTTRPWKMSEMRLSTNQIDRHIELLDLTKRAAQELEANAIRRLKNHNDVKSANKDVDDFDELIEKAKLTDIQRKPYILLQMVCIWIDKRPIGRSKFEAYCNIIALNIERRQIQQPRERGATRAAVDYIAPEYIQNNPLLAENISMFLKVGELGLVALCEELKAPANIFDKKLALKYLTSDELNFFAETGILSLTKDTSIISERREIVTFQHKAIEEFFVALFMASVWKSRAKQRIILLKCRSLPDLFMTSFINVMNLVKEISNDYYTDMYKRITDKESAVASDDIRLYGSRLTRITEEESVQIVEDCVDEKQCFAEGSFGKLFKSNGLKNRCGITVAVKKIHDDRQLDDIPNTVKKEMNVSKVLHPFLLPLIAVIREVDEGRNTFYLISPFCEQGDLYKVLHTNKIPLNQVQRIRIVLQIALGIQHLHTFVEGVKDVIIHKDICSDNIILDGRNNARLIDFGLARDKGDNTNTISKRIHYTHPDVGTGKEATEFWDYFSFGVVIRELLTGLPPEGKKETNLFLKEMKLKDVIDNLDQEVWPKIRDIHGVYTHDDLNKIAESCIQPQSTFSFQKDVVEKVQSFFEQAIWVPENDVTPRCAQCMINPATSKAAEKMHTSNCKESFGLCVPCEKRSILCPVKCYGCGETLKPVIGKDWAALLVAGNDTADPKIAETFKFDVENMEKVVKSKTPLIMGISEENVHVITPEKPGIPEELLPQIKTAMKKIKESGSHTLVVYFSCHGKTIVKGENNNSFQLGSEHELLPTIEFQKLFEQDKDIGKIQKVILFMDRSFPTRIKVDENDRIKAIQLNACESDKTALVKNQASIFTKHLIEGLKAWHCKNKDTQKSASNDYITATTIQEYTSECMKVDDREAVMFISGAIHSDDFKIAYDTAEDVDVEFSYGNDKQILSVDLCQKMEDLENAIKRLFNIKTEYVKIQKDTYRNKDRYVDCTTVENVMTAAVLRQPLIVSVDNKAVRRTRSHDTEKRCDNRRVFKYNGRLVKLETDVVEKISKHCGGNTVFAVLRKIQNLKYEGFGMEVAITQVKVDDKTKKDYVKKKLCASRYHNPFILPTYSIFEIERVFYFVSPYCKNGNLFSILNQREHETTTRSVVRLDEIQRIRIALQVALGIQFLHTPLGEKTVMVHGDISTRNVLLDLNLNARLTDFKKSVVIMGKSTEIKPHSSDSIDIDETKDFKDFAQVIKELMDCCFNDENSDRRTKLEKMVDSCKNVKTTEDFSEHVVDKLRELLTYNTVHKIVVRSKTTNEKRCDICMLNEVGDFSIKKEYHAGNCRQAMQICDACDYNSFLPLKCFCCGESNKPFLGENWGALLIAGEGDPKSRCAKEEGIVFQSDIEAVENVIKRRAVSIRDENLIKILPGGTETIHSKLESSLQSLASSKGVQNILVYFSCHGRDGNQCKTKESDEKYSFAIGCKNLLTVGEFSQELEKLEKIDTFVIILDRCFGPTIPLKKGNLIQINSCGPQETSKFYFKDKSKFTEYFVNALEGLSCQKDKKDNTCEICRSFRVSANGYLSVLSLFDFVKKHLATEQSPQTPTLHIGVTQQHFACNISSDSELDIKSLEDKLESFNF